MYARRQFLSALAALIITWLPAIAALAETPLTIILPYPKGAFDAIIRSLAKPLSHHMDREVVIDYVPSDGGWDAIARLRSSNPDSAVLADAELTLAMKQQVGGRGFEFDQLTPVAKITDGFSVALIAPVGASHRHWPELAKTVGRAATQTSNDRATLGLWRGRGIARGGSG